MELRTSIPRWSHTAPSSGEERKRRRCRTVRRLVRVVHDSLATFQDGPTMVEMFAREQAARELRVAIRSFQPLERQCIIARLCRRMSFERIADELQVTRNDVTAVLDRARERVQERTISFSSPWYWSEDSGMTRVAG